MFTPYNPLGEESVTTWNFETHKEMMTHHLKTTTCDINIRNYFDKIKKEKEENNKITFDINKIPTWPMLEPNIGTLQIHHCDTETQHNLWHKQIQKTY